MPGSLRAAHVRARGRLQPRAAAAADGGGPRAATGCARTAASSRSRSASRRSQTRGGTLVIAAIRDISARKQAEAERSHLIRERALYAGDLAPGPAGRAHRPAEPDAAARPPDRRPSPSRSRAQHKLGGPVPRPRPLQARQRLARPRRRATSCCESVAARLTGARRSSDTVSRQGGDEFVILLSEVQHREDVAAVGREDRWRRSRGPHRVGEPRAARDGEHRHRHVPDDGADAETLIKNADIAMYHAKDHGPQQLPVLHRPR